MPDAEYVPECYACRVSMSLQGAAPEATEHLIRAGRELLGAFKSVLEGLDAFLSMMEERSTAARKPVIQSIPIKREG